MRTIRRRDIGAGVDDELAVQRSEERSATGHGGQREAQASADE
jgi:hypothetical protein